MANLSLKHIASVISGATDLLHPETIIDNLLLDSRKFHSNSGLLFFALVGENHDGHNYIQDLYDRGLRNFVLSKKPNKEYKDCNIIFVPNTLVALQKLAAHIRETTLKNVIAVTGSNGKTIVKEWLFQVLHPDFNAVKSPKSYNSQIGVPLSVWKTAENNDLGIFEAGISRVGEMSKLEGILKPQIGVFTNIGSAHDEFFESRKQKIAEKLLLFTDSKKLIFFWDHQAIREEIETHETLKGGALCHWSLTNKSSDLYIYNQIKQNSNTLLKAIYQGEKLELTVPFIDSASIENAVHCWLVSLEMGIVKSKIQERILTLHTLEMRLELKSGISNSLIINDTYNSDLESLKTALDFLDQQAHQRSRVLILSDILQSGLSEDELIKAVAAIVQDYPIHQWIGVGNSLFRNREHLGPNVDLYPDTASFMKSIQKYSWTNKAVLIKGARDFHFESISQKLELKTHETVLEIHLSRMVDNLNYFRAKLKEKVKTMAMVKAFSYGSGSFEIANLLEFHQVDYLAVAFADEGVELRQAGINMPIMVLNVESSSLRDVVSFNLEPEIFSFKLLAEYLDLLQKEELDVPQAVHIKLDTGMNRLGFQEGDLEKLIGLIASNPRIKVQSIFSHLASSDDLSHQEFTENQIMRFEKMSNTIQNVFNYFIDTHILNSSGISNYPNAQFSMVRLGIGLYGISPNPKERRTLSPVSQLKASVSQIRTIAAGETVGYGMSFKADKPTKIAVISIGYADGLRRILSNGKGSVWIKGRYYPIVGKVCMDMTMIDISNSEIEEGDEVEIIGEHITVYDLAKKMDTIPYEVLTGISQRVKRVYFLD